MLVPNDIGSVRTCHANNILKCLMTYVVGQLCTRTMYFSINDPTAYIICSIYIFNPSLSLFCKVKKSTLALIISKSTYHIYFISWRMII